MKFPLIGNERVASAVENAVESGKIPHAIIIEGEKGQGKRTLAEYLAAAFFCKEGEKPCGECKNCHLVKNRSHPDVIYVAPEEKKKFISVEQIRSLKQKVYIKPHMADGRVIIIAAADKMNANAQNALLKVLEEPPENTLFLLLAVKKEALLVTVLSRCVLFSLKSPKREAALMYVLGETKSTKEQAEELLDAFHGNIGAAISHINKKNATDVYNTAKRFTELIFSGGEYEMLKLLNPYLKDRAFMDDFFDGLRVVVADELKTVNKNGVRARVLFFLGESIDKYVEALKFNANLPLLVSVMVSDINSKMR